MAEHGRCAALRGSGRTRVPVAAPRPGTRTARTVPAVPRGRRSAHGARGRRPSTGACSNRRGRGRSRGWERGATLPVAGRPAPVVRGAATLPSDPGVAVADYLVKVAPPRGRYPGCDDVSHPASTASLISMKRCIMFRRHGDLGGSLVAAERSSQSSPSSSASDRSAPSTRASASSSRPRPAGIAPRPTAARRAGTSPRSRATCCCGASAIARRNGAGWRRAKASSFARPRIAPPGRILRLLAPCSRTVSASTPSCGTPTPSTSRGS